MQAGICVIITAVVFEPCLKTMDLFAPKRSLFSYPMCTLALYIPELILLLTASFHKQYKHELAVFVNLGLRMLLKNYRLDRATVLTYITSSGVGLTQIRASKFN